MKRIQSTITGRYLTPTFALGAIVALSGTAQAQFFTGGSLVVSRVGDGSAGLTSAATSVFLDQYSTAGTAGTSLALPTAVSGSNRRLTNSGSATSEGGLTLSPDGNTLVLAGYDAAAGTTGVVGTTATATNRVVGLVNVSTGAINTTTALTDGYSANNIRGAAYNGSSIYTAGNGTSATGGFRVTTVGGTTSTQLATAPTNTRRVDLYNGQLYGDSGSANATTVGTIGTGSPTTSGQTFTTLTGLPSSGGNPYDFFFASSNTLYIADNTAGVQKYTLSGGTWTLTTTFTATGVTGLTGVVNNGVTTLFAVNSTSLLSITDNGATTFTTLATSGTNTAFRGIRFIPSKGGTTPAPSALLTLLIGAPLVGAKLRARRKAAK